MTVAALVSLAILIVIVGIVCAVLVWLVDSSPMTEPFKGWAHWLVIAIGVLIILFRLLAIAGVAT